MAREVPARPPEGPPEGPPARPPDGPHEGPASGPPTPRPERPPEGPSEGPPKGPPDGPPTRPPGFRTFLILWLTQSLSVWGNAIRFFTITFWITGVLFATDRAQAAYALAAVSICVSLTSIAIAPLAGSWTDRLDRRRLMLVCDLGSGVFSLALGALMLTQRLTVPVLLPWVVLFTVLRSAHQGAFGASYAMLLQAKDLPRGNAMMQTSSSLAGVVAPGIAAVLISLPAARLLPHFGAFMVTGAPFAVLADALTFFVAGGALGFLQIRRHPTPRHAAALGSGSAPTSARACASCASSRS
jgi:DHA3 family macrolide efflux protein-like MFS transporter